MRGESIIRLNVNLGFQWLYHLYIWEMVGRTEDRGWLDGRSAAEQEWKWLCD